MTMLEIENMPGDIIMQHHRFDTDEKSNPLSPHLETQTGMLTACQATSQEKSPGGARVRRAARHSQDFSNIPPAFRIGLDNSAHSEGSVSSPPVCRSSKLADGYLEKVKTPARKKKERPVKRLSIEDRLNDSRQDDNVGKLDNNADTSVAQSSPTNNKATTKKRSSALADAFLQKVQTDVEKDVIHHLRKVPTLAVVKRLKTKWPPEDSPEDSPEEKRSRDVNNNKAPPKKNLSSARIAALQGSGVMSLKGCFESGTGFQNSPINVATNKRRDLVCSPVSVSRVRTSFEAAAGEFGLPLWMGEASKSGRRSSLATSTKDAMATGEAAQPVENDAAEGSHDESMMDHATPPLSKKKPINMTGCPTPDVAGPEQRAAAPLETLDSEQAVRQSSLTQVNAPLEHPAETPVGPDTASSDGDDISISLDEIKKGEDQIRPATPNDEITKSTMEPSETIDSTDDCPVSPLGLGSTISSNSSPFEKLRPSYKVSYNGPRILRPGREWEDGVVDASFPALPRQHSLRSVDSASIAKSLESDHRFDPSKPDSNLFFALLPNDRRFDRERVDPSIPRPVPVRKRSDLRFDPEASGMCSMPGLPWIDRRLDHNASVDLLVPLAVEDHRFDTPTSCLRAPRRPDRSDLQPSVWQTRASEPKADVDDRKWRLKRVWEDKDNKVVDDTEPEYVVAEPQLRAALSSLLGVPESKIHGPEQKGEAVETADEHAKHWKVRTVWDRDGDIVRVDDEASVDCEELLDVFERDIHRPNESIVFDYSAGSLGLHLYDLNIETSGTQPTADEVSTSSSHTEYIDDDDDDDASFDFDDSVYLNDSFSSSTDNDKHNDKDVNSDKANIHDPDVLREKLHEVEQEMNSLILDKGGDSDSREETRKKILSLQDKLAGYLSQLQAGDDRVGEDTALDDSGNGESCENDDDSLGHEGDGRDSKLLRKKLHKVEKLMKRMVDEKGEKAAKRKKYQRLESKRRQYIDELKQVDPSYSGMDDEIPKRNSIHSVLEKIDLEVIDEECSLCSIEEEARDHGLLKRKLRRVEKEMDRMTTEMSDKAKSKKKFKKLAEKRIQYLAELGEPLTEFGGKTVRECVDKALNVLEARANSSQAKQAIAEPDPSSESLPTKTEEIEEEKPSDEANESPRTKNKKQKPRYNYVKLKGYDVCGRWDSPWTK